MREKEPPATTTAKTSAPIPESPQPANPVQNGTVVLDVEQGGIEVPSFVGKSLRSALETAQESGLELNPVGSGMAREQNPAAGTHVTAGSRVIVRFGR
jgi:cell division protein FtsI (penicillin-binding protein 3)